MHEIIEALVVPKCWPVDWLNQNHLGDLVKYIFPDLSSNLLNWNPWREARESFFE